MQQNTEKKEKFSLEIDGEEGLNSLYVKFKPKILLFITLRVPEKEIAEDLNGDVFLQFYKYARTGTTIDDARAFLYRLARNRIIDFYRTQKHTIAIDEQIAFDIPVASSIEENFEMKEAYSSLMIKANGMKPEYREIIELRYIRQLEIEEIATILGKKEGAVRVLIHRAITELREESKISDV